MISLRKRSYILEKTGKGFGNPPRGWYKVGHGFRRVDIDKDGSITAQADIRQIGDGTWKATLTLARGDKQIGKFQSESEAKQACDRAISEIEEGRIVEGTKGKRDQAVSLVRNLLTARRNGNVKLEQIAYNKLMVWCDKNGFDMENVIEGATKELKKSIAAAMGGLV